MQHGMCTCVHLQSLQMQLIDLLSWHQIQSKHSSHPSQQRDRPLGQLALQDISINVTALPLLVPVQPSHIGAAAPGAPWPASGALTQSASG